MTGVATEVNDLTALEATAGEPDRRWAAPGRRSSARHLDRAHVRSAHHPGCGGIRLSSARAGPATPGRVPRGEVRPAARTGRRWRAARASMFFRPCPRCARRGRRADPVIDDPQDHLVGHDHLDLDSGRLRVTGDVAERFAQRGEELDGDVVIDAAVDRAVEEASRFEPERAQPPRDRLRARGPEARRPTERETLPARRSPNGCA